MPGLTVIFFAFSQAMVAAGPAAPFPFPLDRYPPRADDLLETLGGRLRADPFNGVASLLFLLAILHALLAPGIRRWAHRVDARSASGPNALLHWLSELEIIFGSWAVIMAVAIGVAKGWGTAARYVGRDVDYTEPLFVAVILALAATRPILRLAGLGLAWFAEIGGGTLGAWWLAILLIGPLFGSLITEPAAMAISALLLARQFYAYRPSVALSYATLGLLFVNVSVGGTLTNFAAPPIVMVARPWHWDLLYLLTHFGWKALAGMATATLLYYAVFRAELGRLNRRYRQESRGGGEGAAAGIPRWIFGMHILFLVYTVALARHPWLFIGGFLCYVLFARATASHQDRLDLRLPLLVGLFLAGLVVLAGLQGWWLEPVLKSLGRSSLFLGATLLTGINDNAAITYLATLVPGFSDPLKYAVVAGAVTGGGLTVIANAPNPAGQAILQRFFPDGISPLGLLAGALAPTIILALAFLLL